MSYQNDTSYKVYIDKVNDNLKAALKAGLEFIQWDKYVNRRSKVFVKPNFTFPRYQHGVTTSPALLKCLLELLKSKADTVLIGESDGGNHSFTAAEAFQGHDMHQICQETGAELVNLSTLPAETITSTVLGKKVTVQLPKLLLEEIDCFISVPVIKTHVITTVTLSLKNLWGCVPDTMRCVQHQNINHKITLIAQLLKPKIAVIDGIYALDKHGPMYGDPVRTDLVLIADNPVAADAIGASIMGFSPQEIKTIRVAEKAGLGSMRLGDIETNRDWQPFRRNLRVEKTIIDRASAFLFYNDTFARLILDSALTPIIYKCASLFRTAEEKQLASQFGKRKGLGPY